MLQRLFEWLEGLSEPFPEEVPDKPPDTLIAFIVHYARPFWPLLLAASLLATVVATLEVWLFSFVGNLVDWLSQADRGTLWSDYRWQLIGMSLLVLVFLPLLKLFYEAVHHQGLLGNFAMRIRWQAHRYLLRQSMEFYQNDFAGRVATKVMQTALGVRDTVMKATAVLLYVSVYFTAAIFLFAASDLRLTAPMLLWMAGYLLTMRHFVPRLRAVSKEQAEARSAVTGRVVDSYTNIATVKMFAHTGYEDAYAREGMQVFLDNVYRQMRLATRLTVTLTLLNGALLFAVAGTAIWLWQQGAVTTGTIAFSVGLVLRLQGMSQWILWEVAGLFEDIGVVQDGIDTLSRQRSVVDAPDALALSVTHGEINFRDVRFNYGQYRNDAGRLVIDGLSIRVAAGEKVGIVGRSGAGKSTIVSLLLRFHDLESGLILIDGQDISRVTQESLRAHIGMVTQDTSLLHRSVFENISYGRSDCGLSEVIEAARRAHAHEFILELEDPNGRRGYEAHVGERGVKLSGGQRQRIAIARVLLKNAPVLVLDEATSALDSEVEAAIQESLYSLMAGKTVIAIAHRLSTIAAMDRLLVMDRGMLVEEGTHRQLLAEKGLYANLWARQSGGFIAHDAE